MSNETDSTPDAATRLATLTLPPQADGAVRPRAPHPILPIFAAVACRKKDGKVTDFLAEALDPLGETARHLFANLCRVHGDEGAGHVIPPGAGLGSGALGLGRC